MCTLPVPPGLASTSARRANRRVRSAEMRCIASLETRVEVLEGLLHSQTAKSDGNAMDQSTSTISAEEVSFTTTEISESRDVEIFDIFDATATAGTQTDAWQEHWRCQTVSCMSVQTDSLQCTSPTQNVITDAACQTLTEASGFRILDGTEALFQDVIQQAYGAVTAKVQAAALKIQSFIPDKIEDGMWEETDAHCVEEDDHHDAVLQFPSVRDWGQACATLVGAINHAQALVQKFVLADWSVLVQNFSESEEIDYETWSYSVNDGFDPCADWDHHSVVIIRADLESYMGPDLEYLIALRVPWNLEIPDSAESEADVVSDAVVHGKPQVEYLTQPFFANGDLILGNGLNGRSLLLCAADCRSCTNADDVVWDCTDTKDVVWD